MAWIKDATGRLFSDRPIAERIREAIKRITSGAGGLMRIPVDDTDPDMVLGDCGSLLAERDARIVELEAMVENYRRFEEDAVLQCAKRQCARRDIYIQELEAERDALRGALKAEGNENKRLRAQYNDLLIRVGNKYPGETRHETARRYIEQAEAPH